jgi:hypothetical protein
MHNACFETPGEHRKMGLHTDRTPLGERARAPVPQPRQPAATGRRAPAWQAWLSAGLLACGVAVAQPRTATYEATVQGVTSRLTLRIDGTRVEGALAEGTLTLGVRGAYDGQRIRGSLTEPGTGRDLLPMEAEPRGESLTLTVQPPAPSPARSLTMRRVDGAAAAAAPPAAAAAGAAGALDPAIVGRWRNESQINSPGGAGGFAALATLRIMELAADGRVRQWVRSAGGGGNWSHQGGETLEFSGRWQVRGAELWVQPDGLAQFQRAAAYRRVGERLVTESDQGRQIWER